VVNVTDLLILKLDSEHPHGLDEELFGALFTRDRPVIVNFHGYPSAVHQLLAGRGVSRRFKVHGYCEEGTTTTPFDMLVRNGTSRYHLASQALRAAAELNERVAVRTGEKVLHYEYVLREFSRSIVEAGEDPREINDWKWTQPSRR
jgi:xylulose-5-phosphate/fructose-6-phosphate phosphoketolase